MSPKAAAVARLSEYLPPPVSSRREGTFPRLYPRRLSTPASTDGGMDRRGAPSGSVSPPASTAAAAAVDPAHGTEHLAHEVPTSAAVIVYAFNAADQLVNGLAAATGSGGRRDAPRGVGGDVDDHRKCVLVRAAGSEDGGKDGGSNRGGGAGGVGSGGGFGQALAAGLSRPVLTDEMGETHLWVVDSRGRRHLAAAFVSLQRATVFLTLTASGQFPPFRVENRSSAEMLAYRQVGIGLGCV